MWDRQNTEENLSAELLADPSNFDLSIFNSKQKTCDQTRTLEKIDLQHASRIVLLKDVYVGLRSLTYAITIHNAIF